MTTKCEKKYFSRFKQKINFDVTLLKVAISVAILCGETHTVLNIPLYVGTCVKTGCEKYRGQHIQLCITCKNHSHVFDIINTVKGTGVHIKNRNHNRQGNILRMLGRKKDIFSRLKQRNFSFDILNF